MANICKKCKNWLEGYICTGCGSINVQPNGEESDGRMHRCDARYIKPKCKTCRKADDECDCG